MSFEDQADFASQVADLNKYGQALNQCGSVEDVALMTLEATALLFDPTHSTFVEVREEDLRVVHSTNPNLASGDEPSDVVVDARESGESVVQTGPKARIDPDSSVEAVLAVPAKIVDDVVSVLVMRSTSDAAFYEAPIEPVEILTSHAATAINNVRSRQRLERAHVDLEKRKEMVEMYDRLLRHDLGNDLQVISGYADALAAELEGEKAEYAERIRRASESSADLIRRVGELVSTLDARDEPEPRNLRDVLANVVRDNRARFHDLTIHFDPEDFDYHVFGGELLDSVFDNLVSNAVVHNEGAVTVSITASAASIGEVVVSIADDGEGIPAAVADDLFKMGVKGPESTGTGLGLGFARALAEAYGGEITVHESERGGAEFRVRLERA